MNRIFEDEEVMVLSNKEHPLNRGTCITFADGSFVDISTRTITRPCFKNSDA